MKVTTQKMKFSIKDFFSKCVQIHRKMRLWSHLLNKSLMENFIFCAMSLISSYINYLNNILYKYSKSNEHLVFMGDFNVTMDDKFMMGFYELNDPSNLIDKPTCYKNFDKPSYFQHRNVFETDLSDFHL